MALWMETAGCPYTGLGSLEQGRPLPRSLLSLLSDESLTAPWKGLGGSQPLVDSLLVPLSGVGRPLPRSPPVPLRGPGSN